jgi:hypothetical protein
MILDDIFAASRAGKVELDPFNYSATWNTLGANATTPVNVGVNADSDFVIRYSMIQSFSAAGTNIALPDYLLTIFDTGSGRQLQDAAQHVLNMCGTAQRPFIWSEPKLIKQASVLVLTLTNNTATAARVDITLHGFKLFYLRGFSRDNLAA